MTDIKWKVTIGGGHEWMWGVKGGHVTELARLVRNVQRRGEVHHPGPTARSRLMVTQGRAMWPYPGTPSLFLLFVQIEILREYIITLIQGKTISTIVEARVKENGHENDQVDRVDW